MNGAIEIRAPTDVRDSMKDLRPPVVSRDAKPRNSGCLVPQLLNFLLDRHRIDEVLRSDSIAQGFITVAELGHVQALGTEALCIAHLRRHGGGGCKHGNDEEEDGFEERSHGRRRRRRKGERV